LWVEASYYTIERGSLQIRGSSDDTIIVFGLNGLRVFRRGTYKIYVKIKLIFDRFIKFELLEFKVPMVCLATGGVSLRRECWNHRCCATVTAQDILFVVVDTEGRWNALQNRKGISPLCG
jgi:hypothetical protein